MPAAVCAFLDTSFDLNGAYPITNVVRDNNVSMRDTRRGQRCNQSSTQKLAHNVVLASGSKHCGFGDHVIT